MAVDGKIRILICNNSAGIGVNFFGLNNIVHYGSPGKLTLLCNKWDDVVEMECCQMNPYYLKNHKGHLKKVECELVKLAAINECETICAMHMRWKKLISFPFIIAVMFVRRSIVVVMTLVPTPKRQNRKKKQRTK